MITEDLNDNVLIRSIKRIPLEHGDVLQAIKASDHGFSGFGEAYFSYIHYQTVKAWKLHTQYTANFICPVGKVEVVIYKEKSPGIFLQGYPKKFILSEEENQYQCLTIPPGIWYGFKGLAQPTSLIFSLLNGEHSPNEQKNLPLNTLSFPMAHQDN